MKRFALLDVTIWFLIGAYSYFIIFWIKSLFISPPQGLSFPGMEDLTPFTHFAQTNLAFIGIAFLMLNILSLAGAIYMRKRKRWAWTLVITILCFVIPLDAIHGGGTYFELRKAANTVAQESYESSGDAGDTEAYRKELSATLKSKAQRALLNWVTLIITALFILTVLLRKKAIAEFTG